MKYEAMYECSRYVVCRSMAAVIMHDDGVFNDCQLSDQEFDDEVASIGSQTNVMDHNASNDIIDS